MIKIITIEREYGSGGALIARQLAERLGWKHWDEALTAEIARIAKVDPHAARLCDERVDPLIYRLFKVFARGSYERALPIDEGVSAFDTDRMVAILREVIEDVAARGNCVIVGRGAPYFLRELPDAFHVFLYAPRSEKLRRLRRIGHHEREAEELVDTVDRDRIEFVKHYFGADWPTRCLYHMMINTAVGDEIVISTILDTMRLLERHLPAGTAAHQLEKCP